MAEEKMVVVRNRNVGGTGYALENGFHRQFEHNEIKTIPLEELRQLSYAPGGEYILKHLLVIEDKSALEYLNLQVEPEYFYSDEDIKKLLLEGTLDQLEDTLNFAPDGVIESLKKIAVDLEVPDMRKREMISKKTGFDINGAINLRHLLSNESEEAGTNEEAPKRKAAPITSTPQQKADAPARKYKVVEQK